MEFQVSGGKLRKDDVEEEDASKDMLESIHHRKRVVARNILKEERTSKKQKTENLEKQDEDEDDDVEETCTVSSFEEMPHLKTRMSPSKLVNLINSLSDTQKASLKETPFKHLLCLKLTKIPLLLAHYIVSNFDHESEEICLENERLRVSQEDVEKTLGLPMGTEKIVIPSTLPTNEFQQMKANWIAQFGARRISENSVPLKCLSSFILKNKDDAGPMFKKNIILYITTSLIYCHGNQNVCCEILPYLTDTNKLDKWNWCEFVMDRLLETRKLWRRGKQFNGPLLFLMIHYVDPKGACPRLKSWTTKQLNAKQEEWKKRGSTLADVEKGAPDLETLLPTETPVNVDEEKNEQSSEVGIPAKKPQHEKEDSNQVGVLQQCKFEQMQGTVIPIPDPKGLDKFHSSRHLDLLVGSLNYNLSVAGNSSTSIPATAAHEELDPLLGHKTMAGSGSTKNADETLPRGGNKEATNHLSSIHGEISSNCFHENSPQESASFNLTEIAEKMGNFDEVDSFGSESTLVSVGGYKVKPKYEFPLGHILSKYGDIGVNCSLTVKFRSLCMEHLCDIIQNLMDTNIVAITDDDLEEMMGHVGDLEKQNLDIEWLKERLNEISEAKRAIKVLRSSSNEKTHHAELKAEVKKRSQQLEAKKREFALKEVELQELGKEIFADKRDIVAMENGVFKVEKVISENKAKLTPFVNMESLGQGLI